MTSKLKVQVRHNEDPKQAIQQRKETFYLQVPREVGDDGTLRETWRWLEARTTRGREKQRPTGVGLTESLGHYNPADLKKTRVWGTGEPNYANMY